ncbi:MAG: ribonuclease Z [Muribaculaceae bacterium]|nr:ribonuclease Z [Muribaculaceae bacterium]
MSYFNVTILGCGSATPTLRHQPSAQIVRYRNKLMLIDCAEGTQLQMRRYGLSFAKISDIFISHLHGDHFLGLPGLLSTMALHDVDGAVTVHTFAEGAELLKRLMNVFCRERSYNLVYDIIDPDNPGTVYEDNNLIVRAFPLYHRVPCVGFRFDEKPKRRHIDGDAAKFFGVPHYLMNDIKDGADFVGPDGRVVSNDRLTKAAAPALSYAYCSDTMFDTRVADAVRGVDTIYHEATYGDDAAYKAAARGHATARQAGIVAQRAGASRLIIGHYSKSVDDEAALVAQAAEEFSGTVVAANEGLLIDLI